MPIPIGTAMLLSSAIPAVFQAGKSLISGAQGRKYAKTKRPKYEIPQNLKDYLAATKFEAGKYGLPGQGQIERKMAEQQAGAARAIQQSGQSSASQLASLAALDKSSKDAVANLGVEAAQFRAGRQQDMYGAQRVMAGEEKAAWEWDKQMPYLAAMETASKFERQANQELYQGLEGLADVATSGLMMGYQDQNLGTNWFGKTAGDAVGAAGAAAGTGMGLTAAGAPSPTYFDPNAVYGTGAAKPYEEYGAYGEELFGGDMPMEMTQPAVNAYFGGEVPMDVQEYYGLGSTMGNALRNIFRRRGSSRSYTSRRGF